MSDKQYIILNPEQANRRNILQLLETYDEVSILFSGGAHVVVGVITKYRNGYREVITDFSSNNTLFDVRHGAQPYFMSVVIHSTLALMNSFVWNVKSAFRRFKNNESLWKDRN